MADFDDMDLLPVVATTFGGALSATLGVLVGGVVTRRAQERHRLRSLGRSLEDLPFHLGGTLGGHDEGHGGR